MKYDDLKIGMKVKVVRKTEDYDGDWEGWWWENLWVGEMDEYVKNGKVYTIRSFQVRGVVFEEDKEWRWPWQSLEPAEEELISTSIPAKQEKHSPFLCQHFSMGDRFRHKKKGIEYILARTEILPHNKVALIDLESGNVWENNVAVHDPRNICSVEAAAIFNGDMDKFERV